MGEVVFTSERTGFCSHLVKSPQGQLRTGQRHLTPLTNTATFFCELFYEVCHQTNCQSVRRHSPSVRQWLVHSLVRSRKLTHFLKSQFGVL